jgi:type VI secretion system protein ImpH
MRTAKRKLEPSVVQRLIDEPHRFQFAHAVRTALRLARENGISHDDAFGRVLRFQNSLLLGFPASQVEAVRARGDIEVRTDTMLRLAFQNGPVKIAVTPAFIGFLGGSGALPFHFSETVAAAIHRTKDDGVRAFMDAFSNRLVGLYFRALEKYRLEYKFDTHGEDGLLPILKAIGGMPELFFAVGARRGLGGVTDHVAAYYAALLRTRPVSAYTIRRVLSDYFSIPIEVEEFVGSWDYIPGNRLSTLGTSNPRLGYGATLGVRHWRHDRRVRLHIGPLDERNLERFLPRGDGAAALEKMLALFGVGHMEFEARLILDSTCIEPLCLTTRQPAAARRLGWSTFLTTKSGQAERPEVRYMLRPP